MSEFAEIIARLDKIKEKIEAVNIVSPVDTKKRIADGRAMTVKEIAEIS